MKRWYIKSVTYVLDEGYAADLLRVCEKNIGNSGIHKKYEFKKKVMVLKRDLCEHFKNSTHKIW